MREQVLNAITLRSIEIGLEKLGAVYCAPLAVVKDK